MCKKTIVLILCSAVLSTFISRAQQLESMSYGDTVSNFQLGTDFRTGNIVQLNDYKDKIVILDFWNSYCFSCIAGFPFLEKLQRQFPNDIQILLVNGSEDSTALAKSMQRRVFQNWTLPDLPIIVNARKAKELFPYRGVPHHVWIGKDSRVILMGAAANTNASKVETVLAGKPFFILNNLNTAKPLPDDYSLEEYASVDSILERDGIQGMIADFQNNYSPLSSRRIEKRVYDGEYKSKVTYLNFEIAELFKNAKAKPIDEQNLTVIYGGEFSYGTANWWVNYVEIQDVDTTLLTTAFVPNSMLTDSVYIKSRYSYEQVTPQRLPSTHDDYMFGALNDYFGKELGIKVSLVKKKVQAYALIGTTSNEPKSNYNNSLKYQLDYGVNRLMKMLPPDQRMFMVDCTGLAKSPDLGLQHEFTWEEMTDALERAGIRLVEKSIPLNFLRFENIL